MEEWKRKEHDERVKAMQSQIRWCSHGWTIVKFWRASTPRSWHNLHSQGSRIWRILKLIPQPLMGEVLKVRQSLWTYILVPQLTGKALQHSIFIGIEQDRQLWGSRQYFEDMTSVKRHVYKIIIQLAKRSEARYYQEHTTQLQVLVEKMGDWVHVG